MLFNSLHFLVFFPLVTIVYFLLPAKARWAWLLAASCWFYASFVPKYLLILAFTILVDYVAGIAIAGATGTRRRLFLVVSIVANCGVLALFKYFNFLNDNVAALAKALHWQYGGASLSLLLPIGLSFHTFQSMSYTIEVYRGNYPAERRLGIFALYVMFFPQLVAGPVERPQNLLHQFDEVHSFDYRRVTDGLKLMAWGFFKKIVIADRLAFAVNMVYDHPADYGGFAFLVATWFFAFQIFCDFSGYSDIALGSAQVLGFRLMQNFRQPYLAQSVNEFWRRWHISLSTWFRDYLYIPLGGSRVPFSRQCLNLMIVFLVSGLWHGANWTYVIWGALNGAYIVASLVLARAFSHLPADGLSRRIAGAFDRPWIHVFVTFNLISLSWVFFRARSVTAALYALRQISHAFAVAPAAYFIRQAGIPRLTAAILLIALLETVHRFQDRYRIREFINSQAGWVRWTAYAAVFGSIVVFGEYETAQQFIYFQF